MFQRIKVALADESSRPWHEVESCFNDMQYRQVRERQMKELELEDDLLNKPPVRFVIYSVAKALIEADFLS